MNAWKVSAKRHRAAAIFTAQAFRRSERIRRGHLLRVQELEQALEELLVGAESQTQSHADVSARCRSVLGVDQAYIDMLLHK